MSYLQLISKIRWSSCAKASRSCARLALLLGFSLCNTGLSKPDLSLVDDAGGRKPEDLPEIAEDVFKPINDRYLLIVDSADVLLRTISWLTISIPVQRVVVDNEKKARIGFSFANGSFSTVIDTKKTSYDSNAW
jgi:hypothetical protein